MRKQYIEWVIIFLFLLLGQSCKAEEFSLHDLNVAAKANDTNAQLALAKMLINIAQPKYDHIAFYWANKAASANRDALLLLADMYLDGIGTEVRYDKALEICLNLTQENYPLAELRLAKMYYYGLGIESDPIKAKQISMKLLKQGVIESKEWIAVLLKAGFQETDNQDELKEWLVFSAESGDSLAIYYLGMNYLYGQHQFEQDITRGLELIKFSADKQCIQAQRELGKLYEMQLFGLNNDEQALTWYKKAADMGDEYSQQRVADLNNQGKIHEIN